MVAGIMVRNLPLETYVRVWYDVFMNSQTVKTNWKGSTNLIKRADIILIIVCLLAALLAGIFFIVNRRAGSIISISYDGIELYRINLEDIRSDKQTHYYLIRYEDAGADVHIMHYEQYPELPTEQNYNLFSVADSLVTMEAANCRDQICVRHKPISAGRESIICLPNKLVIEMIGNAASGRAESENQNRNGTSEDGSDEPLDGVVG